MNIKTKKRIINILSIIISALLLTILFYIFVPTKQVHAEEKPYIDESYYPYIVEVCEKYNIKPELIASIIWNESRWNESATNGDCIGLMQINPKWQKERMKRLGVESLLDGQANILVGVDYISELMHENDDLYLVLMKYNMHRTTAYKNFNNGNYSEYAIEVPETAIEFEKMNEE